MGVYRTEKAMTKAQIEQLADVRMEVLQDDRSIMIDILMTNFAIEVSNAQLDELIKKLDAGYRDYPFLKREIQSLKIKARKLKK